MLFWSLILGLVTSACSYCSAGLFQVSLHYSLLGSFCGNHSIPGVVAPFSICSCYPAMGGRSVLLSNDLRVFRQDRSKD